MANALGRLDWPLGRADARDRHRCHRPGVDFLHLGGTPVVAFGGIEEMQLITYLSPETHFIERLRMIDTDHLQDEMTVIDPVNFTKPWHLTRTYERVKTIHRMVYEDCEGEERVSPRLARLSPIL